MWNLQVSHLLELALILVTTPDGLFMFFYFPPLDYVDPFAEAPEHSVWIIPVKVRGSNAV